MLSEGEETNNLTWSYDDSPAGKDCGEIRGARALAIAGEAEGQGSHP